MICATRRRAEQLAARLQKARVVIATLLDERDLARRERDDALAEAGRLHDTILSLKAERIADHPSLWHAMADRAADEAEAYARQLVANGIEPDRDFRNEQEPA